MIKLYTLLLCLILDTYLFKILIYRFEYLSEWESGPDEVFRIARQRCESNLSRVADFVECKSENMVFVENPTTAINAVVNSLKFSPDDVMVMASHAYEGVNNTMHALAEKIGVKLHIIDIPWPIESEEQIVQVNTL